MTKTRSIISETIIGKDEPLQPFRSAMIRDTEDVVARLRGAATLLLGAAADIESLKCERQSLSDRIDVLDHFRADVCNAYESDRDEGEIVEELGKLIRGVRAALHQEGIAP